MGSSYETDRALQEYLLFHYGTDEEILPNDFGLKKFLHFPVRCVTASLPKGIPQVAKAIDLGCAVGRSSFELTRYSKRVVGIDRSHPFIAAARQLQHDGMLEYFALEEGMHTSKHTAKVPEDLDRAHVEFFCADVMEWNVDVEPFDIVLVANLICRLADPKAFLDRLSGFVAPGGRLILASPYSWLEEFTTKEQWQRLFPEDKTALEAIHDVLSKHFILDRYFDLPFLIREHRRKYQWDISQVSTWIKIS